MNARTDIPGLDMLERSSRKDIEDVIEALIARLDGLDGDHDLEDGADAEPWLAGLAGQANAEGNDDDRELDLDSNEGDGFCDEEPSLGALERHPGPFLVWSDGQVRTRDGSQTGWAMGGRSDMEVEHDGREPD